MTHETFHWNQDQTDLFGQYWKIENAKGNIALVHGMGEHSGRYADFVVPSLNAAGYSVIAFDHFGHGKTPGKRGHCPSYEAVLDSVDNLLNKAEELLDTEVPLFLYGHSMGGNVVANHIIIRKSKIKGAVITSPMLKLAFEPPAWKMIAGKFMRNIYPAFQEATGLDASAISRNVEAVKKYKNDPLVHDKVTINFSLPFFEAGDYAIENAAKISVPAIVVHGTADAITDHKGSESFVANSKGKASIKLYDGAFHELHNEPNQKEVLSDLVSWLNSQL